MHLVGLVLSAALVGFSTARLPASRMHGKRSWTSPWKQLQGNPSPDWGSVFSVLDFGAVGDGVRDNTEAFSKALNATAGVGGVVWVPSGRWVVRGSLVVPKSTVFAGVYSGGQGPAHNVGQGGEAPVTGTVLMPYAGRGNVSGQPFLTVLDNSAVTGMTFYYPEVQATAPPPPYPWTISLEGEDCAVMSVELLNSYNGVRAVRAPRHLLSRVTGQPTNTGIFIDETYDIGRVEDCHFNPWFSGNKPVYTQHQLTHGTGFVIARSDWEMVEDSFVFGMAVGWAFVQSSTGSCNGAFTGIGADMCPNASVLVEAADPWGILITNGEFTSFIDAAWGNSSGAQTQVVVAASNAGAVRFSNSAFWGPSTQIASVQGSGSIGFSSCIFNDWTDKSQAAIHVQSGAAIITGNEWQAAGQQVQLDEAVQAATITSNLFTGPSSIVNNAKGDVQIGLNAEIAST